MTEDTENAAESPEPDKPRTPGVALAGIAIIVALVALALAGWSTWQLTRARHADASVHKQAAAQVAELKAQLAAQDTRAQAGKRHMDTLESNLDDLHSTVKGLALRTTNLETAVASLNGRQQSAHDSLLLDDAELLLRTGQQRLELFHDAGGALKAYDQAIAVLGQVQNPAYAPVRSSVVTERDALAAAAPASRQSALDALSALRGKVATLPLASAEPSAASSAPKHKPGFWARVGHAFSGIVKVSHDTGSHAVPGVDAQFARQALALDLAQAQEALLAFDDATSRRALKRADELLATQFNGDDDAVRSARARIDGLLSRPPPGKLPQLGGALAQLRSLRASQPPATPAPATTAPAAAASTGGAQR